MKQNTIKFLPLIIILFSVVGVLSWYAKNQKNDKIVKPETVNPSELESDNLVLSPTPTTSFFFTDEPTAIPTTTEPTKEVSSTDKEDTTVNTDSKGGLSNDDQSVKTTTITKTITCTPVYGMADTCTEHIVVDTGAESAVAYGLSAFSYLAGLVAFVKSKKA